MDDETNPDPMSLAPSDHNLVQGLDEPVGETQNDDVASEELLVAEAKSGETPIETIEIETAAFGSDESDLGPTEVTLAADRIEADLTAVDRALARLEDRSYGRCAVCGTTIDDALLEADPTLGVCPAHVALDSVSA